MRSPVRSFAGTLIANDNFLAAPGQVNFHASPKQVQILGSIRDLFDPADTGVFAARRIIRKAGDRNLGNKAQSTVRTDLDGMNPGIRLPVASQLQ